MSGVGGRHPTPACCCACAHHPPLMLPPLPTHPSLQSQLALQCDRKSPQGLVDSAKLFQASSQPAQHCLPACLPACPADAGVAAAAAAAAPCLARSPRLPPPAARRSSLPHTFTHQPTPPRHATLSRAHQEAAGTFALLRDSACLKVEAPRPLDLTPEAAAMLERLMLAQAQVGGCACVHERRRGCCGCGVVLVGGCHSASPPSTQNTPTHAHTVSPPPPPLSLLGVCPGEGDDGQEEPSGAGSVRWDHLFACLVLCGGRA